MNEAQGTSLFPVLPGDPGGARGAQGAVLSLGGGIAGRAALFPDWETALGNSVPSVFSVLSALPGGSVSSGGSTGGSAPSSLPAPGGSVSGGTSTATWQSEIAQAAQANGVPPTVLSALIQEESGGNPEARSPVGAMGLTQLMPETAASLGVTNPYDPVENLWAGAEYLGQMLRRFGSLPLALAAYNAGPGAVARWGGIPPYPATEAYVANILRMSGADASAGLGSALTPQSSAGARNGPSLVGRAALPAAAEMPSRGATPIAAASVAPSRMADGP